MWRARVIRVDASWGRIRRCTVDNIEELEDLEGGLSFVSPKAIMGWIEGGKIDRFIATKSLRHCRLWDV